MPTTNRADDERLLDLLFERARGYPHADIARRHGVSTKQLLNKTGLVKAADLEESGEPRAAVAAHYWGK